MQRADTVTPGHTVATRYQLVRLIGRGGMGSVWLARDQRLAGKEVAVKLLSRSSSDGGYLEACLCAMAEHENVVTLHDSGRTEDGCPFLVFELVRGRTLAQLGAEGGLDFESVVEVARQLGAALTYMHGRRIIHRDIKLHNVMVTRGADGGMRIKLIDFGIATAIGEPDCFSEDSVAGTPGYMAPEQLLATRLDGRVDQYGLACTLQRLLFGEQSLETHSEVATRLVESGLVPRAAAAALAVALSDDPRHRFSTIADFIDAFVHGDLDAAPDYPRTHRHFARILGHRRSHASTMNLRPEVLETTGATITEPDDPSSDVFVATGCGHSLAAC